MEHLLGRAGEIAEILRRRGETVAVAESAAGGLVSAALLAVPGASAYFVGGAVIYTRQARAATLGITEAMMQGMRASTEPYAALLARTVRERHEATWGLGESGAAGPTGNRYGDAAGHTSTAVAGPRARAATLETASDDRVANMRAFAGALLDLFLAELAASGG